MQYPSYRDSGIPHSMHSKSATGTGTMVTGVSGQRVVVYDILSSAATTLTDGSATVIHVPVGSTNLTAGIDFGAGNGVVLGGAANITITSAFVK